MDEISDLLKEVVITSERIRRSIKGWLADNHGAAPAAHRLANLALEIANTATLRANRKLEALNKGAKGDIDSVRILLEQVGSCNDLFETLEHSSARSLHPVLSPMVQAQLEALNVKGDVLVTSVRDVSYELETLRSTRYEKLVSTPYLQHFFGIPLHVFRVPHPPTDWPMYHVLLFHEIGHAAFLSRGGIKEFQIPVDLLPKGDGAKLLADIDRRQYFEACANAWYEEVFADTIGLELVGPGFLFAFSRVLGGGFSLTAATGTHPPTGLRMLLMLNSLEVRGILDVLPSVTRSLFISWHAALKEIDSKRQYVVGDKSDNDLRILLNELVNTMSLAHDFLRSQTSKLVAEYTADKARSDLETGALLHTLHIPPIETNETPGDRVGSPLDSARIFAACWAAYMLSLEDPKNPPKGIERALLESLDASQSLHMWATIA